uniref:DUF4220 domain-containing protein n=1 Tax=Oryza brachyantha TaxID=4533 RepID=J3N8U7_ORYBR
MLVLENQLPLLLLQRLLAVLLDIPPAWGSSPSCPTPDTTPAHRLVMHLMRTGYMYKNVEACSLTPLIVSLKTVELDRIINHLVLRFLGRNLQDDVVDYVPLGHHPLDIYHTSLVYAKGAYEVRKSQPEHSMCEIMPTVMEMHEAGIKFKRSKTDNLFDIHFKRGVLSMPEVIVDDSTECVYLNLMLFERLHVGTGTLVTSYVIFMDNMIDSAKDVSLLGSKGVLRNLLGSDEAAAKLFTGTLSRGAVLGPSRELHNLQRNVKAHCRRQLNRWRANFVHTHCSNPWVIASLIAAFLLLAAGLMQTVYTILPFYDLILRYQIWYTHVYKYDPLVPDVAPYISNTTLVLSITLGREKYYSFYGKLQKYRPSERNRKNNILSNFGWTIWCCQRGKVRQGAQSNSQCSTRPTIWIGYAVERQEDERLAPVELQEANWAL